MRVIWAARDRCAGATNQRSCRISPAVGPAAVTRVFGDSAAGVQAGWARIARSSGRFRRLRTEQAILNEPHPTRDSSVAAISQERITEEVGGGRS